MLDSSKEKLLTTQHTMEECEACADTLLNASSQRALDQAIDRYSHAINASIFKQKTSHYLLPPNFLGSHQEKLTYLSRMMGLKISINEKASILDVIQRMSHFGHRLDKLPD